jgi:signal transduction histidine kinase
MIFGAELGILTGIFSFLLVDYFLFDPIFQIYLNKNPASAVSTIIGLNLAFLIGIKVHQNFKKLNKETKDLRTQIEARDQFTASTVHDFKNPITTIKLHTQLIENKKTRKNTDNLLAKSTETIVKEADKLLMMTNQLLDYSKIKNGKFLIKKTDFDLYELCKNRIEVLRESYPNREFIFYSNKKTIRIKADKIAIDRIITNLMTNAIKYSSENKPIALRLYKNIRYEIRIIDKGDGIAKQDQESLFEPFYQANKTNQGLGLGLYIVKSLVELHQGKISFESIEKKGTTFIVSFPIL